MATPKLTISPGADATSPHAPARAQHSTPDLRIKLWRDHCVFFTGTAAQLTEEGLIPDGLEWPDAAGCVSWQANGIKYGLCRTRPRGHRGPKGSWWQFDHWTVNIQVVGRNGLWVINRLDERKVEEAAADLYRRSPAGLRQREAERHRYQAVKRDKAFQAFKVLALALVPKRRRRSPP